MEIFYRDMRALMLHALEQILDQGEGLLRILDDESFKTSLNSVKGATIGGHYRHCLDHFEKLFTGIDHSLIDYDARRRDQRLESSREFALERTEELRLFTRTMDARILHHPIQIRCAVSGDEGESPVVTSTIEREIMFCISHAIHHYALIGMMCGEMDIELPADFGVAPSTLHFRSASALQTT